MPRSITPLIGWLLAVTLCTAAGQTTRADRPDGGDLARQVADTYGFADWDSVEVLRFTFNVQTPDRRIARTWTWRPKENTVTLEVEGADPITYRRDELADDTPEAVRQADKRFINDSYWLLFPFQLIWSGPVVTDGRLAALPIGGGEGHKLTVKYPAEGGYTPGDAYDLYLGEAGLIVQWVFRKGGGEDGRAVTWENHLDLGPIKVSTEHRNDDGSFRLWFSDLSAKITGTEGPVLPTSSKLSEDASRYIHRILRVLDGMEPADLIEGWPRGDSIPSDLAQAPHVALRSSEDIAADGFRFHLAADAVTDRFWVRRSGGFMGEESWYGPATIIDGRYGLSSRPRNVGGQTHIIVS